MQKQVRGYNSFCQRISAPEVNQRPKRGCGRQTMPLDDLFSAECGAANRRASTAAAAYRFWNRDLDWLARRHLQTV
jgi:hypothetical protein